MKLPVDIPAVIAAAIDIDRACEIPVSVNILIDETASSDFQVFVRAGFNSESPNSRVMVSYFPTQNPDSTLACDLTVIAAGDNDQVGALAESFREAGTPVLVVAQSAEAVRVMAEKTGYTLPEEDVVGVPGGIFNDDTKDALGNAVGRWIVQKVESDKRLAFSIAYPFVRKPLAYDAIRATALQNAGVGVVTFIPGVDMPIMTANQIKMVLQIAAAYGQRLGADRVKEMIGVLINAFICRGIARSVAGAIPALGWAIKGAMGYIGTQAIGRAAIEYFEGGGNIAGLAALANKTLDDASKLVEEVSSKPSVRGAASKVGPMAYRAANAALDAATPVAKAAGKTIWSSIKPGGKRKKHSYR